MNDYVPISCAAYDVLEAAAVRRSPLRIALRSADGMHERDVKVLDLFSKDRFEYARLQDLADASEFVVRLDAIEQITDMTTHAVYVTNTCSPHSSS
ncbi:MAG: hypothetical protein C4326_03330 [Ignavibacteria bacterium]